MHDAVLDALSESFGDNAGFALELYAQYRLNPGTVGDDWRRTFEQFEKRARAGGGVSTDSIGSDGSDARISSLRQLPAPGVAVPAAGSRPACRGPRPRRCGRGRSSCPSSAAPRRSRATWTPPSPSRPQPRSGSSR